MALDGIVYRGDHPAPRNAGKGSALTVDEFDDNFYELYTRIKALETTPPTAVSISNITVTGSQLLISMSDGVTTYGPFTLPIATFRFRGDYLAGTAYAALDIVSVPNQGLFLVNITHTGEDPFDPAAVDGSSNPMYTQLFGEGIEIYDVGFFYPGRPGLGIDSDGWMFAHELVRPVIAPALLTDSKASLRVAPAAALSFPIYKNGGTGIGSVDFAMSATAGTFTFTDDTEFDAGDVLQIGPPVSADANAKDLMVSLTLTRIFS
jgi:hypothetical protein